MDRREGMKETINFMSPASNQLPNGNLSECGYYIQPYMFLKIEEHYGKFFQTQKLKTRKCNMGQLKLKNNADILGSLWGLWLLGEENTCRLTDPNASLLPFPSSLGVAMLKYLVISNCHLLFTSITIKKHMYASLINTGLENTFKGMST